MKPRLVWCAAFLISFAAESAAQMAPAAFSRAKASPQVVAAQVGFLEEASPYVGWGGVIGAVAGTIYGAATIHHNRWKPLLVPVDALIGFSAGLVGGMGVYVVKRSF